MALRHLPVNSRQEARAWNLQLGIPGFKYADLNRVRSLAALDEAFLKALTERDADLGAKFVRFRNLDAAERGRQAEAELLIDVGPYLGEFIARMFHIGGEYERLCERVRGDRIVFEWKRQFIERRVMKTTPTDAELAAMEPVELEFAYREVAAEVMPGAPLSSDPERELADLTMTLVARAETAPAETAGRLATVEAWTRALAFHPALAERRHHFTCFHLPQKLDHNELVPRIRPRPDLPELFMGPLETRR